MATHLTNTEADAEDDANGDEQEERNPRAVFSKRTVLGTILLLVFVIGVTIASVVLSRREGPVEDSNNETVPENSFLPSSAPSFEPTSLQRIPTPVQAGRIDACNIELDVHCVVTSGDSAGLPCEMLGIGVTACREKPTMLTLRYIRGSCEESDNRQFLKFACSGFPDSPGDSSFVTVTGIRGEGSIYQGWVAVGNDFSFVIPENERDLIIDARFQGISNDPFQEVYFSIACSNNLELFNRFGAFQVVGFSNVLQGSANASVEVQSEIFMANKGNKTLNLTTLTAETDFLGLFDLTNQVVGQALPPGQSLNISTGLQEIDAAIRKRYTTLTLLGVTAIDATSSQLRRGDEAVSFFAGNSVWNRSTPVLSLFPAVSPAPTPDPETSGCTVEADIQCLALDHRNGIPYQECSDLADPRSFACTNNLTATGLGFRYIGGDGFPNTIWVELSGGRTGVVYEDIVELNDVFYGDGDFRGEAEILLYNIQDGGPGTELETILIDVKCLDQGDENLKLNDYFGPLELVAFRNALGYRSSLATIQVRYYATNSGLNGLNIEEAFIDGTFNAVLDDPSIPPKTGVLLHKEEVELDLGSKFTTRTVNKFTISVTARGAISGLLCADQDELSI